MNRIRYEIDLTASVPFPQRQVGRVRPVSTADRESLAALMLDAYMGTIDYDGESYDDALDEIDDYLGATPLLEHSYVVEIDDDLMSAVLMALVDDRPFISYVMTRAGAKNTGLARQVTSRALAGLLAAGYDKVVFYITEGNTPSERLFRSLGAIRVDEGS